jgi:hypothetical protein
VFLYWSTFQLTGVRTQIDATARIAGATGGSLVDLRSDRTSTAGRCIVCSNVDLASPPAGVTFLVEIPAGLDNAVPANVRTFINSQLGITVPTGLTWRQLFRRLMTIDGQGRWGTLSEAIRFWTVDETIDV